MATENGATRKRTRKTFDASKLTPDSLVTMADIAQHTRYSRKYLYNLRSRDQFIEPARDTGRALRFRWGDVLSWIKSLPPTAHGHGHGKGDEGDAR